MAAFSNAEPTMSARTSFADGFAAPLVMAFTYLAMCQDFVIKLDKNTYRLEK